MVPFRGAADGYERRSVRGSPHNELYKPPYANHSRIRNISRMYVERRVRLSSLRPCSCQPKNTIIRAILSSIDLLVSQFGAVRRRDILERDLEMEEEEEVERRWDKDRRRENLKRDLASLQSSATEKFASAAPSLALYRAYSLSFSLALSLFVRPSRSFPPSVSFSLPPSSSVSLPSILPLFHPSWPSLKISIISLFDHSSDSTVNVILLTFRRAGTIGKLARDGVIVELGSTRRRRTRKDDNGQHHRERLLEGHHRRHQLEKSALGWSR